LQNNYIAALPKMCLHNNMEQATLICGSNASVSESAIWSVLDTIKTLLYTARHMQS